MSVTAAQGFAASGVSAGIKDSGAPDLALVVNRGPSDAAAAVFTSNRVQAAPVRWSRRVIGDGALAAVVLNSGGANACTGPAGEDDARAMAERTARALCVEAEQVAVCSTGLIGVRLPMDRVTAGIDTAAAALSEDGGELAAIAIKTTDSVHKTAVASGPGWTVGGMAKGAGMLAPGLATMLVVLTTDADVGAPALDTALRDAVRTTFDRVDSDGCMSTNDTVLLLASGASGVRPDPAEFTEAVHRVCLDLALRLVADAEGASKEIEVRVVGAASEPDAVTVGRSIARNNLLKCALHGEDPNWGRVLSAIGTTSAVFDPDRLDVSINGVQVCRDGAAGEPRDKVDLSGREVTVTVDLRSGDASATIWTNDLTAAYVHENSAYSS
ncbi:MULTISPECIES: bifunctional glutamate N-acetyltransferase/amino-acid acetyltransferase ArgJ [unclassified Streptomyces]|uniref:bifunctional glutamate N-acetyltransferase/amino-acid acetyltransferase ArgJ n=1 Tax=unclassified Streptomyces TaxID=2593676 RepID=UPI00136B06FD|nr:bifunctional glutamate N-acetyltransferase/amino-acid acetyltransferase ArgJ [Streptomyces sp. SID335]MYZ18628.1 bifunctional glutamate N-acetyltransferase/amino-acid acetyltransferase ArgJ [Streptomyces sp. SID337]NDZ91777.1 bifunctional glutamate N-acetyltransferase/amino-acid acetyltransferase ArgJ [Streptomyces sp. SID10115]NEA01557.1 bifunctional glutamate N-acetyltransferase/amino-acid acetyltransferase ArgJ [Streptomyces sp. SID10116]NEB48687.1 bifunctional glutamate N-acetyltransfera